MGRQYTRTLTKKKLEEEKIEQQLLLLQDIENEEATTEAFRKRRRSKRQGSLGLDSFDRPCSVHLDHHHHHHHHPKKSPLSQPEQSVSRRKPDIPEEEDQQKLLYDQDLEFDSYHDHQQHYHDDDDTELCGDDHRFERSFVFTTNLKSGTGARFLATTAPKLDLDKFQKSSHRSSASGDSKWGCRSTRDPRDVVDDDDSDLVFLSTLPEDTFSFIVSSDPCSIPFITGSCVVFLKFSVFLLMLANLVDPSNTINPLGIPSAITWPVVVTQVISLAIGVMTQDDLISALNLIRDGFSPDTPFQAYTYSKFILAVTLEFLLGVLGLFATLFLTLASASVKDLILNFTAVEFVSLFDNVVFSLSENGFFGIVNKRECYRIKRTEYQVRRKTKLTPCFQVGMVFCAFLCLLVAWSCTYFLQRSGGFLPQSVILQFDDIVNPILGSHSGHYSLSILPGFSTSGPQRFIYSEEEGEGVLQYCSFLKAWTFRENYGNPRTDACKTYIARSSKTLDPDVTTAAATVWTARVAGSPRFFPLDWIVLEQGCLRANDCGGVGRGQCIKQRCQCVQNATHFYYGFRCDFSMNTTCTDLKIDETTGQNFESDRLISNSFKMLKRPDGIPVQAYHRPVYYAQLSDRFDIIMYFGVRWIITRMEGKPDVEVLARIFIDGAESIRIHFGNAPVDLRSRQIIFNSPLDSEASPAGHPWYLAVDDAGLAQLETRSSVAQLLLCSICNENNLCRYSNKCVDGKCLCSSGEKGTLCQIPPVGNGRCDKKFNSPLFEYDGGDWYVSWCKLCLDNCRPETTKICSYIIYLTALLFSCQATCVSSEENICGVNRNTKSTMQGVPIGFPSCIDPAFSCEIGTDQCWAKKAVTLPFLSTGKVTSGKLSDNIRPKLVLAANGRILAVGEPIFDSVRVFDLIDGGWKQRGRLLSGGGRGDRFGEIITLATLPGTTIGTLQGVIPLCISTATTKGEIEVFCWIENAVDWWEVVESYQSGVSGVNSLNVAFNGGLAYILVGTVNNEYKTFEFSFGTPQLGVYKSNITDFFANGAILSGDGRLMAKVQANGTCHISVESLVEEFPSTSQSIKYGNSEWTAEVGSCSENETINLQANFDGSIFTLAAADGSQVYSLSFLRNSKGVIAPLSISSRTFRYEFADTSVMNLSSAVSAQVSHEATSVTILHLDGNADVYAVRSSDDYLSDVKADLSFDIDSFNKLTWRKVGVSISGLSQQQGITISHDAGTVVVEGPIGADLYESTPPCGPNEYRARLSIAMDAFPEDIVWAIDTVAVVEGYSATGRVIESCDGCYGLDLATRYSRTIQAHDYCFSEKEARCLRLSFVLQGREFDPGSGFAFTGPEGEELAVYTGSNQTVWVLAAEEGCELEGCPKGESSFVVILPDFTSTLLSFNILDKDKELVLRHDLIPDIIFNDFGHPYVGQFCFPPTECLYFELYSYPRRIRRQDYTIVQDGKRATHRAFDYGQMETIPIGNCGVPEIPEVKIMCRDDDNSDKSCAPCPICSDTSQVPSLENLIEIDIPGITEALNCTIIHGYAVRGELDEGFCEAIPSNAAQICGCRSDGAGT